jgi:hypothetical protein
MPGTKCEAYKAISVCNLLAEVRAPSLPLNMDGRQAKSQLRTVDSRIDMVIGQGIKRV